MNSMNICTPLKHAWLLAPWLLSAMQADAASIAGAVYDARNEIFIESARVFVQGTDLSTTTARGGRYRITGVQPGEYSVTAVATGYPPVSLRVVVEDPFEEKTVNLTITDEDVFEMDAFVVEGSLIGQAKSLDLRRASNEFKEIVASDAFGQFADRNPGEALQRVAGIAVEKDQGEGSFLIIRGGAPEFSSVEIDGINLATPQEDGRRINLNVITVDQLERIEVSKTWKPSQKANVVGGTVNLITRSALDRGERYLSFEGAATYREIADDEFSWRGAVTFGDVVDSRKLSWMGDKALGIQFSVNQSLDHIGSDTVSWIWDTRRDYPFRTRPGEEQLFGYTLIDVRSRDFQVERERIGASLRMEFLWNDNHRFYASLSHNKFDDTELEQTFARRATGVSANYAGTSLVTLPVILALGQDPEEPFNKQRLASLGLAAALTFNEAIQLGEIAYDPELKMFTRGGPWPMSMNRTFSHTFREDRLSTYHFGGRHRFWRELSLDWKAYNSEASQNSEQHWLRFYLDGATGGGGNAVSGVKNPFLEDISESKVIYNKASFFLRESLTATRGRQHNFSISEDEREGFEINLAKTTDWRNLTLTTEAGMAFDARDKAFEVDRNSTGLLTGSLDIERWPGNRMSLVDPLFDGGELEGFEDNFGPDLRFGPKFQEENTLAFLRDPNAYGANFVQDINDINNNFTSRVTTNYRATEDITGYYLQQTVAWRKWTFIFGARYEKTENTFTNLKILTRNPEYPQIRFINPTQWKLLGENFGEIFSAIDTSDKEYDHLLPAFHAVRKIGDSAVLRASITKTIARPLFSDLIPREVPDISGGNFQPSVRLPAFDLRPMESRNYDLSLDFYFQPVGLFSIAVFYKDLDGPIYDEARLGVGPNEETQQYALRYNSRNAQIDPDNILPGQKIQNNDPYDLYRKRNADEGKLYGIELTFDRKFNFLDGFWNGFGVNSNIAWFDSEATLLTQNRVGEKVSLFKQPDKTANLSIYYEKYGVFARLSYNLRGTYLNSVSGGTNLLRDLERMGDPLNAMDIHVDETARLDFTFRYSVTPNLQLFVEAINLTNEPEFRYRGDPSRPMSREYTERLVTVGLKWNL
jgi:TonB-dependent receptor